MRQSAVVNIEHHPANICETQVVVDHDMESMNVAFSPQSSPSVLESHADCPVSVRHLSGQSSKATISQVDSRLLAAGSKGNARSARQASSCHLLK